MGALSEGEKRVRRVMVRWMTESEYDRAAANPARPRITGARAKKTIVTKSRMRCSAAGMGTMVPPCGDSMRPAVARFRGPGRIRDMDRDPRRHPPDAPKGHAAHACAPPAPSLH